MFIINGICYAGELMKDIEVVSMKILEDFMMLITFSTGEERLFDATVLDGPAFAPLKEESVFKSAYIDHGVVTWMDGDIDCAPEFMYEKSYAYESVS